MIEFINKGLLTTIQDKGRFGYQKFGVPAAGAMDKYALNVANLLAGNHRNCEALEVTAVGPTIKFHTANTFAVVGAPFPDMKLNGKSIENNRAYVADADSILEMGTCASLFRAYIAFHGGLAADEVMGSKATYIKAGLGGLQGRAIQNGDTIRFIAPSHQLNNMIFRHVDDKFAPAYSSCPTVRAMLGPQDNYFTQRGIDTFYSSVWTVAPNNDRMGYRLEGPEIERKPGTTGNIISDGIPLGAVQIPDKNPIVMMTDRQTTGGYTKIAVVINVDIPLIAQLKTGDTLRFAPVYLGTAQRMYQERMAYLRALDKQFNE